MDFKDILNKAIQESYAGAITGEYWIDSSGYLHDAEDGMHEPIALEYMFGDSKIDQFLVGAEKWDNISDDDKREYAEQLAYYKKHQKDGRPATNWVIQHEDWIRVIGSNFELWGLDQRKLERIANAYWEITEIEPDEMSENDGSITIYDLSNGADAGHTNGYEIKVSELLSEPSMTSLRRV